MYTHLIVTHNTYKSVDRIFIYLMSSKPPAGRKLPEQLQGKTRKEKILQKETRNMVSVHVNDDR